MIEQFKFICDSCLEPKNLWEVRWIGSNTICRVCYNTVASENDPPFNSLSNTPPYANLSSVFDTGSKKSTGQKLLFKCLPPFRSRRQTDTPYITTGRIRCWGKEDLDRYITEKDREFLKSMNITW